MLLFWTASTAGRQFGPSTPRTDCPWALPGCGFWCNGCADVPAFPSPANPQESRCRMYKLMQRLRLFCLVFRALLFALCWPACVCCVPSQTCVGFQPHVLVRSPASIPSNNNDNMTTRLGRAGPQFQCRDSLPRGLPLWLRFAKAYFTKFETPLLRRLVCLTAPR